MSTIRTKAFGGDGGTEFKSRVIRELGLRIGEDRVTQITINGDRYGSNIGTDNGTFFLSDNEYINTLSIRSGIEIDYIDFITNKGNSIKGGGSGGSEKTLDGIRVIAIGGKTDTNINKLNIMYIDKYKPSTVEIEDVGFILNFTSPFQELVEYTESTYRTASNYEKITESMSKQQYSASVEGEYFVKVAASTEIEIKDTSLNSVKRELEQELKKGKQRTIRIEEGYVGITLINGSIMKGKNIQNEDVYWMYPTSEPSFAIIKLDEVENVFGHYDLTGELAVQMPKLGKYKTNKYGYIYYEKGENNENK